MSIVKGKVKGLSLNVQHDYITLRTPNGNYTLGFNGAKASGNLVNSNGSFERIDDFVMGGKSYLKQMELLLNPTELTKLWKEWNNVVPTNDFKIDDEVKLNHPIFLKKYPKSGIVRVVKPKNVAIKFDGIDGLIAFDYQYLTLIKRK